MNNSKHPGRALNHTALVDVLSSGVVVMGSIAGVAATSAAVGEDVAVHLSGVFELPKGTSVCTQGDKVYWNATTSVITKTATGNIAIGHAATGALAGDSVVDVRLMQF